MSQTTPRAYVYSIDLDGIAFESMSMSMMVAEISEETKICLENPLGPFGPFDALCLCVMSEQ